VPVARQAHESAEPSHDPAWPVVAPEASAVRAGFPRTPQRIILHVDMDAFFAAIEQLRRPELRGKPVVVGGSGDPRRRGVVSTASYEARAYGIHSAMPLRRALRACPGAVFLPVDFPAYRAVSERLMHLLRVFSPLVEPLGLDEAFVDLSDHGDQAVHVAQQIKTRISAELGLPASVGVGPNKLVAKIASGLAKPDGLTVIPADEVETRLRGLPVTVLWGVGPKTAARLRDTLGIETVGDLAAVPRDTLQRVVGPGHGQYLYQVCRGTDESPVDASWTPKSYSRETTFQEDVCDRETLVGTLGALAEDVVNECVNKDGYLVRTVTLKIRFHPFQTHTRARTLAEPTSDREILLTTAAALLDRFALDRPVRLVGVRLSSLHRDGAAAHQQTL
jgi:DNA polymerase-4